MQADRLAERGGGEKEPIERDAMPVSPHAGGRAERVERHVLRWSAYRRGRDRDADEATGNGWVR
jgi:hypothetical protein